MSPWNKCTHRHEGMQLQGGPRVCLWTARTETQQEGSWQGKLVRLKGAGSGGTCVPGQRAGPKQVWIRWLGTP